MEWTGLDDQAMERVLQLAFQGQGSAAPNPLVGALVVEGEEIIAEAFHRAAGEEHAEILALRQAGSRARGATLYINLEPCCHQGRTPPCVPQILQAGVARVVVGMLDPDPRVSGQGVAWLRDQGVAVQGCPPEWVDRCLQVNAHFVHSVLHRRPFVTLKYAMTADGKVATENGDSQWVSGPEARAEVHRERSLHQAVLVGSGTALQDDPRLNVRGIAGARQPVRVIADRRGRLSPQARLFNSPGGPIWIGHGSLAEQSWQQSIQASGGELFMAESLDDLLQHLHQQGIRSLMLEGGPALAGEFLRQQRVQRLRIYLAPKLLGGDGLGPFTGPAGAWMKDSLPLHRASWNLVGPDLRLDGELDDSWRSWQAACL